MHRFFILEVLFVLLGIALLVAVIKYPKDAFIKIPLGVLNLILRRILHFILSPLLIVALLFDRSRKWRIVQVMEKYLESDGLVLDDGKEDIAYPATSKLSVDFAKGDKYAFVISKQRDVVFLIADFLGALTVNHSIEEFTIRANGDQRVIVFPPAINFYDFLLLVMHLGGELGEKNCIGIFKSTDLDFYTCVDPGTLNNMVGITGRNEKFSIHMIEDHMDNTQFLKLNQKLKVDVAWLKRWRGVAG